MLVLALQFSRGGSGDDAAWTAAAPESGRERAGRERVAATPVAASRDGSLKTEQWTHRPDRAPVVPADGHAR